MRHETSLVVLGRPRAVLGRLVPLAILLAFVLGLGLLASLSPVIFQRRATLALIDMIAVVGLYVFIGNTGILSFSGPAFMAIGAYASALTTMRPAAKAMFLPDLPRILASLQVSSAAGAAIGAGLSAGVALLVGVPLMRLSGISASIATFALLVICYVVFSNWSAVTGGQQSLMGLPTYAKLNVVLCCALGSIMLAFLYQETASALSLRASREDEVAARASGVRIVRHRVGAFVLSGGLCGLAGVLYGHFLGTLRIDDFYFDTTFLLMAMLVTGGMRSLTGAVLGTVVIAGLSEMFQRLEVGIALPGTGVVLSTPAGLGDVALALAMLLIILFKPKGLSGGREVGWPVPRRHDPA